MLVQAALWWPTAAGQPSLNGQLVASWLSRYSWFVTWPLKTTAQQVSIYQTHAMTSSSLSFIFAWIIISQSLCATEHLHANDGNRTTEQPQKAHVAYRVWEQFSCMLYCFHLTWINNPKIRPRVCQRALNNATQTEGDAARITALTLLVYLFISNLCNSTVAVLSHCICFPPSGGTTFSIRDTTHVSKTLADHTLCTSRRRWFHAAVPQQ